MLECGARNRRSRDNNALNRSDISRRGWLVPRMVGYRRFYHPLHSQIQTFPVARLTRALYSFHQTMQNPYQSPSTIATEAEPQKTSVKLTVQEFNAEAKRWSSRLTRCVFVLGVFDLLVLVAVLAVVFSSAGGASWMVAAFMIAFFGVSHLVFHTQLKISYQEFPQLFCYNCDGNLLASRSIVIATGNCPNCGRRVLHDDTIGH